MFFFWSSLENLLAERGTVRSGEAHITRIIMGDNIFVLFSSSEETIIERNKERKKKERKKIERKKE